MCSRKFKVKEFFNVNPKYLLEGYSIMEVGIYNSTKNKASVLIMNQSNAIELVVSLITYHIYSINGEKVNNPISSREKEIIRARRAEKEKVYQHSYYLKVTKEKRKEAKKDRLREGVCSLCGETFTYYIINGKEKKLCAKCTKLLKVRPTYTKVCKECGKEFTTKRGRQVFCSNKCFNTYWTREKKRRRKELGAEA